MTDRKSLRLAATLSFAGVLMSLVVGLLHPEREPANNHAAVFAEYSQSGNWTAIHLGQFFGMAVLVTGLLVLFLALRIDSGMQGWVARIGALSAAVALALYGVLQAVDGVALKQAVDAWVRAPEPEKAARFASAEVVRWLEWGTRSYQSYMLGLALILFAIATAGAARIPKPVGYLMGLSGVGYIWQGWVVGSQGFSANNTIPTLLGIAAIILWSVWLLIYAWRMRDAAAAA